MAFTLEQPPKNQMLAHFLKQGLDSSPVQHWTQGLSRMAHALLAGTEAKEEKANERAQTAALAALLGGGSAPAASSMPPMTPRPQPQPPVSIPGNVSSPVPPDDPTMQHPPSVVQRANAPQGSSGITSGPRPATGMHQPTPSPLVWGDGQVAQPGPLPPAAPPMTSSAAPSDMQARIAAMLDPSQPAAVQAMGRRLGAQILAERMKPPEYKFQVAGDKLYRTDGRGGSATIVADATKAPDAIRVANEVLANPAKYGFRGPDDPALHEAIRKRLTGVQVAIDQRSDSAFRTKAGGLVAERFNKIVEAGHDAQSMVADLHALRDIGSRIQPGKGAQLTQALGPFAELAGVKIEGLDDLQAYQSIVSKLAPRMRVAGSGATSDFEMRQFLSALPSLGNTPGGNEIITNTLDALQQHRIAAAEIASRALSEEITTKEAERQIRELPNPMELWRKSNGSLPSANPSRAQPQEIVDELRRRGLVR